MKYKKLHIGPGQAWNTIKESKDWECLDIDPVRATAPEWCIDFNHFKKMPLENNTCDAIYASHIFEHINPRKFPLVLRECYRILRPGGYIRIVIPDPVKSMKAYMNGQKDFSLFKRRRAKILGQRKYNPTLFELMREDFVSFSGQTELLKDNGLAHQNAWDKETMCENLKRAGFNKNNIYVVDYEVSKSDLFKFESKYKSEATQKERSQYFEAMK